MAWLHGLNLFNDDPPPQRVESVVFAAFTAAIPAFVTFRDGRRQRQQARRTVGPRYDTDRAELRQALTTGEPPADPTLDGPLLAAIKVVQRIDLWPSNWAIFGAAVVLLVVASFVANAIGMPWGLLVYLLLPLFVRRDFRLKNHLRRLARLRAAVQERMATGPADPDALTYADLRSD